MIVSTSFPPHAPRILTPARLERTLAHLEAAKVVAIIRAKNSTLALERGLGTSMFLSLLIFD